MSIKLKHLFALALLAGATTAASAGDSENLAAVLAAQPEDVQARYVWRHPQETLEFFDIAPGMTVVEVLPGAGWYTKILLPYIGADGGYVAADYAVSMWPLFGFFSEEFIAGKADWPQQFTAEAEGWGGENGPSVAAFAFGSLPEGLKGTADAVLLIRALHNLARFESQGGYLTAALQDVYDLLKPGGVVGVVQHQARDDMPDDWANGSNGYLKQGFVIAAMEQAGFEYIGSTEINQNPKDQPTVDDMVWRLPPSLATSKDNPELRAEMEAIGESNRMTLKFRKPL